MIKSKTELQFEHEVIDYLTKIGGVKQWEYKPNIKTTEQLWDNFKLIIEQNNRGVLSKPLSETEFNQVKKEIDKLDSPYKAGQFLYGMNGVAQIEIDLDNDEHVFLTILDQAQVGGGGTVYQVVNQIDRKRVVDGKQKRRFDVTLLINGLPIIQIELKKALHSSEKSFNQMKQYISEKQYSNIYSTLQVLIGMTPHNIRYMANTKLEQFNTDFAFNWQDEIDAKPVRSWKTFADKVLSIPMAHDLATRYIILDGTKNKESIKVMRPYQVYATKRVLEKVIKNDFSFDDGKLGYVWHTTGSGKTITSFKTAWLASRLPNVDKVVFLVDRIALTNQTVDAYRAYDPINSFEGKTGVVSDTANVSDLHRKLTRKSENNIIVTSIQKMARYVKRESFKEIDKNILFIVDEAHRSTGDGVSNEGMLESIRSNFRRSAWVGYTGTPKFPETQNTFGDFIHTYTIKEAIADRNVLGFNVEFKETIKAPENPSEEDIDDMIRGSVYDTSPEHVDEVVKDIFNNWRTRSNNRKYNALFTVHVGGNKPSTPRAMEYFDKFVEENKKRSENEQLKVAISFSVDTSNGETQLETNNNLLRAMQHYNKLFYETEVFDMQNVREYTEDVVRRLNKTADDGKYLDLVIVVDQLLTGFDAPELNTLYIDRTLKNSNLIQAYSRTNRIHDYEAKPFGNVINYRWPEQNEIEMNSALRMYSNREYGNEQQSMGDDDPQETNIINGVISRPFKQVKSDVREVLSELSVLTDNYTIVPKSEREQQQVLEKLRSYNKLINQIKQYSVDENNEPISAYDKQEDFYEIIGITEDQEKILTKDIASEIRRNIAVRENIDISQVNLKMTHIKDIIINYDYLIDLIARMADEVHANEMEKAEKTRAEISLEVVKSESENEKIKVMKFVDKIIAKEYTFDEYPAPRDVDTMNRAMDEMQSRDNLVVLSELIRTWGLDNSVKPKELEALIKNHKVGYEDLDKQGELNFIINDARTNYERIASDEVKKLKWLTYKKEVRNRIYEVADEIKKSE